MDPTPLESIYAAVDITGLSTNVSTILIGFIGISLLFVAYRYIRKSGVN